MKHGSNTDGATPPPATQPEQEIAQIDNTLAVLRESWLDAAASQKDKWMGRINDVLDARLIAMRRRDAQPLIA